jgi:metallo-beta-lactamase class B
MLRNMLLRVLILTVGMAAALPAQSSDWTEPFPPHHVVGNVYYVGSRGLASYLITSPQGHVLINSSLAASVPLIRDSVEKLGFHFNDVKILLISHAHWDHCAGSTSVRQMTGAAYMVMEPDVPVVQSGGKADFHYGDNPEDLYPPARVDRILHDRDEVRLGGNVLVAHLTPGHTKGCTTWTMKATEKGRSYNVVIVGSPNLNAGYKLVGNTKYPNIAQDYERCFRTLKALPCDIFLGAHGAYYNMEAKYPLIKEGAPNPFVDADGYRKMIDEKEAAFHAELLKQKGGK